MSHYEMLADRLRQIADRWWMCKDIGRTLHMAATAMENKQKEADAQARIIEKLKARIEPLTVELRTVQAERDAAVADMSTLLDCCKVCAHEKTSGGSCDNHCDECERDGCRECPCHNCLESNNFLWRGIQKGGG